MAPLAASLIVTLAATAAVRVGLAFAIAERSRRSARAQRFRERQFALLPHERPAEGLKRMMLGQLDLAIELLEADDGLAPSAKAVHETRKALKRMRALVTLLEDELGDQVAAHERALLRDAGRRLAGARDAEVMVGTLDELVRRHRRKLADRRGVIRLRAQLVAERDRTGERVLGDRASRTEVLAELHAARARVSGWNFSYSHDIRTLEPALARLYRQSRRRHRRAARGRGDRAVLMHQWRKSVKDLRYAAEALSRREPRQRASYDGAVAGVVSSDGQRPADAKPGYIRRLGRRADELGELLGEEHDLVMLAARLRLDGKGKGRGTRRLLLKLIDRRRRQLRKQALREGARLHKLKPNRFIARVRSAYASEAGDALSLS